ncbi:beta-hexosaminidase subunit A1-like [Sycon ciliatum]|uniref:beta-hexosaminidase subunit A1-like n=1 Tax=Sycon ciliatum TaxID=27933 RepID=UPI0031F6AC12
MPSFPVSCAVTLAMCVIALSEAGRSTAGGVDSDRAAEISDNQIFVWPLPQKTSASGPAVPLSPAFKIRTTSTSKRLQQAIERYTKWIVTFPAQRDAFAPEEPAAVASLQITVDSGTENLTSSTSYAYNLSVSIASSIAELQSDTVYGAMYGLETFSQLVVNGSLVASTIAISDAPVYGHRGLMIDTGRRFFPPALVMSLLDSMSYMKMNVLHFHLSDLCRFSVESVLYPQLTATSNGFYKQEEIVELVAYAKDRGIRVIPEFDVPGHSHGFVPLAASGDVVFCSDTRKQLCNDEKNRTISTLKHLFTEMATLFEDELFHIGCDETGTTATCPLSGTTALEQELLNFLPTIGRTAVGWEEVLFGSKAATPKTIIDTWSRHDASETTPQGFFTIESSGSHFYVNHATLPYTNLWTDISAKVTESNLHLLLGGEFSMWSDNYCYITQCYINSSKPVASWMYDRRQDSAFAASVTAMIWPRGIVAAGSFWNYQSAMDPKSVQFTNAYAAANQHLLSRDIASCPSKCTCNELTQCDKPYPHS